MVQGALPCYQANGGAAHFASRRRWRTTDTSWRTSKSKGKLAAVAAALMIIACYVWLGYDIAKSDVEKHSSVAYEVNAAAVDARRLYEATDASGGGKSDRRNNVMDTADDVSSGAATRSGEASVSDDEDNRNPLSVSKNKTAEDILLRYFRALNDSPEAQLLTLNSMQWRVVINDQFAVASHAPGTAPSLETVLTRLQTHHVGESEYVAKLGEPHLGEPAEDVKQLGNDDVRLLPYRVALANSLARRSAMEEPHKVVICATVGGGVDVVSRELLPWILYHTELGVGGFFLLYDGTDAEAVALLQSLHHVLVRTLHDVPHKEQNYGFKDDDVRMRKRYETWARNHWQWGNRPGNYVLMVKQTFGQNEAIQWAKAMGSDWIMHLDPDEYILPLYQDGAGRTSGSGRHAMSFSRYLAAKPPHVSSVRIFNAEAQPEHADVVDPRLDVTLFKMNKALLHFDAYSQRAKVRLGDNHAYLILYSNGKSVARVDSPNLRSLGPHFWKGDASDRWIAPVNKTSHDPARRLWRDTLADDAAILHYAYTRPSDVANKALRSCPGEEYLEAARRGNRTKTKECFVIDFDQEAFHVSASGDDEAIRRFFVERMVLQEGSRVRCHLDDNQPLQWCRIYDARSLVADLMRLGLLRREHSVQAVTAMHWRLVRAAAAAQPADALAFFDAVLASA